jgi:uncharacterized membrane protein
MIMDFNIKNVFKHIKSYTLRGLLAIIPLALTVFVIRLLYISVDKKIRVPVDRLIGFDVPGLGIIALFLLLYVIGFVTSNVIGKQFLIWLERLTERIPLINTTYHIGKQLTDTLSLPERQVFRKVVLIDFLKPGYWNVGFVTGIIVDKRDNNKVLLKVFVPTVPNPTSGFFIMVQESETHNPGWTVEEAMRLVISGGIIGPTDIRQ